MDNDNKFEKDTDNSKILYKNNEKSMHNSTTGKFKRKVSIVFIIIAILVGVAIVYYKNYKQQVETQKILAIANYDEIGDFGEYGAQGLALVSKNIEDQTFYGFINERYEEVIPCIFYSVEPFKNKSSLVVLKDKYAIIDTKGKIKRHLQGDELMSLFDTVYHWAGTEFDVVRRKDKFGLIENKNKAVIACTYDYMDPRGGYLVVGLNADSENKNYGMRYGAVDKKGELFIPVEFMGITPYNHNYFADLFILLNNDRKYGMVNKKGEIIIPFEYDGLYWCSGADYLIRVRKGEKYGVFDLKGKILTTIKYDYIGWFNKYGLASVQSGGKYGLLNENGEEILPLIYDNEADFLGDNKYAKVEKNGLTGLVDKTGKLIIPAIYEEIEGGRYIYFSDCRMLVKKNGKYGFVDTSGKEVIKCKYDNAYSFCNGKAEVEYHGKVYDIDVMGNRVY